MKIAVLRKGHTGLIFIGAAAQWRTLRGKISMVEEEILKKRISIFEKARSVFSFLNKFGFQLSDERPPESIFSRAGWELQYKSDLVTVRIEYYDMELVIVLVKGDIQATYMQIDREIFDNVSGFKGCMFPESKLVDAIDKISSDIQANYKKILSGSTEDWVLIKDIVSDNQRKQAEKYDTWLIEAQNPFAKEKAHLAFRQKDYNRVVELLPRSCME